MREGRACLQGVRACVQGPRARCTCVRADGVRACKACVQGVRARSLCVHARRACVQGVRTCKACVKCCVRAGVSACAQGVRARKACVRACVQGVRACVRSCTHHHRTWLCSGHRNTQQQVVAAVYAARSFGGAVGAPAGCENERCKSAGKSVCGIRHQARTVTEERGVHNIELNLPTEEGDG